MEKHWYADNQGKKTKAEELHNLSVLEKKIQSKLTL